MIEWYDFYIFGSLTTVLSLKFYPPGNDTFALIAYLATFAVGFLVRPFGALFFGRLGDMVGRRIAFIFTLTIMGFSTASIGLLPTYQDAGWFSPIMLILIRVLQGPGAGRRIRRRGGLCRRARARQQARLLHQLHPDHGHTGTVHFAGRDCGHAAEHEPGHLPGLGMAPALPALDRAGGHLALHPPQDERVAHLHADQGGRHELRQAADRGLYQVAQPEAGADFAGGRNRWARAWCGIPGSFTRSSTCRRCSR